jgi:allantoate deiminase
MVDATGQWAVDACDALTGSHFSDHPDYLFRPYLGSAHLNAVEQVAAWMGEAGMTTRIDGAGNLIGRYGEGAKTLIIGSHIDSVRDAGNYDGPLGVMLGVAVGAALNAAGRRLPFAIEVYAFGDEEGSRFPAPMLCSRAVAGALTLGALEVVDAQGMGLAQALELNGLAMDRFLDARRDPAGLLGYIEAHIEQGPVLEAEGLALGVVTAIAAQIRFAARVTGIAGHAGTNAMSLRKDALAGAAEMMLAIERIAGAGLSDLVGTVGRISAGPGAPNVVPGEVAFTIDLRAGTTEVLHPAEAAVVEALNAIAGRRGLTLHLDKTHELPPSPCDEGLRAKLSRAVEAVGVKARDIVSGAGHDAMVFSPIVPSAMLFIRCKDGISHNPLESVAPADADLALKALLNLVDQLEAAYD